MPSPQVVMAQRSRRRFAALASFAAVICLFTVGASPAAGRSDWALTSPAFIERLATQAYIWGLAPEFVYRFSNYNSLITAPLNTLGGGSAAAAWNNQAANGGDASVLYLNAMLDLSGQQGRGGAKELVLTVPPSNSNYYVISLLDDFINTVGTIGTRTTPSTTQQTYLLVGPTSRYAHTRIARIHGFTYRVVPLDTNLGWMLIRIRADTLLAPDAPASAASILKNVVERFALSSLARFEARRHRPNYFKPGQYTPTEHQIKRAERWQTAPTDAVPFFKQVGASLTRNPLPGASTGLNGISLRTLPSWIAPQSGASMRYRNPSYGQKHTLALFKPIGLTANGFRLPPGRGAEADRSAPVRLRIG